MLTSCLHSVFLPLTHMASKVVIYAQDNLMKARDERVALMNELLGAIRMVKFMAWERNFENRVLKVRNRELKYQQLNYTIEVRPLHAYWQVSNAENLIKTSKPGLLECHLEWLAYPCHACVFLALFCRARTSAHSLHRIHVYKWYVLRRYA